MSAERRLSFTVTEDEAGGRVDRVAAARFASEGLSRSAIARLCDSGRVRQANLEMHSAERVRAGQTVEIAVPPPDPVHALAEAIPLTVLHEDSALLVIDKPAGLVVHPARGHATGTLVNAVLGHVSLGIDDDPLRPGIVHRLDKGTSGLLVVAKTGAAREALKAQFHARTIERAYVAITVGVPPERVTYDTLHARHPTDRKRFTTRVREGRRAITHVVREAVLVGGRSALVTCRLETGRTHQIRVHLAEAGFPLLGDPVYGRTPRDALLRTVATQLGRQALHAGLLGFAHPDDGRPMRFESAPPADFADALRMLRG